jgi:hypothetical protein
MPCEHHSFRLHFVRGNGHLRRPPPPTRALLPNFTSSYFEGVCEYLDDLVTQIDAPLHLFPQLIFRNLPGSLVAHQT